MKKPKKTKIFGFDGIDYPCYDADTADAYIAHLEQAVRESKNLLRLYLSEGFTAAKEWLTKYGNEADVSKYASEKVEGGGG